MKAGKYLPHSSIMARLEEIKSVDENGLTGTLTIRADDPFLAGDAVPAWVAIEYMAQAIAAYAGHRASLLDAPVETGFLVGSRRFEAALTEFPIGSSLEIAVSVKVMGTGGLSSFACRVDVDGVPAVSATLNVYKPNDLESYLKQ